jgi:hypothetical protein
MMAFVQPFDSFEKIYQNGIGKYRNTQRQSMSALYRLFSMMAFVVKHLPKTAINRTVTGLSIRQIFHPIPRTLSLPVFFVKSDVLTNLVPE